MATVLRPNSELVACAWLGGIDGLSPDMVATQLPRDTDTWKTTGFITVYVSGGQPSIDTPLRSPVLGVDCWAPAKGSSKPQWFMANHLAELIDQGCRSDDAGRWLTLPAGYMPARVTTAYWLSEPQRRYDDPGNLARYVGNLQLNWVPAESS